MHYLHLLLAAFCSVTIWATEPMIPASPLEARPVAVGSRVPLTVALRRPDGANTTLGEELAGSPTVVIFYRGGWCPYCSRHLAGLATIVPELTAAGWKVVALVPEQPTVLTANLAKGDGGVPRLSDAAGDAMRAFGVAFQLDAATVEKYKEYKVDLEALAGNDHRWLPVPSVFLVAADGTIRFAHADPDYKVRLDPQVILAVAKAAAR